ncbi:MAG: UPF0104 family protein, partial [Halobacteriaceae archaeon]
MIINSTRRLWTVLRSNGVWLTALLAVGMFVLLVAFADLSEVISSISTFGVRRLAVLFGLSTIAYLIRFSKWEFYIRWLNV